MKVIDDRFVFRALVVICIMFFSSVLYSMGACNYNNQYIVTIGVKTANQQKVVGNKANYSCYVGPRELRELLVKSNYVWDYDATKLAYVSIRPDGDEIRLKAIATGADVVVKCSIVHEDFVGDCEGSTEINIVPPAE